MSDDHISDAAAGATPPGTASEVFGAFLRLGLTSFGGPIAHLGYFRTEFVERRKWLTDKDYADLVALCQFLPGPASSQVGFALGLQRAGGLGAVAAWCGFTLPSALIMIAVALFALAGTGETGAALLHGLKLVAVAIVAQAVAGMARSLCPDRTTASLALAGLLLTLALPSGGGHLLAIAVGVLGGSLLIAPGAPAETGPAPSPRAGMTPSLIYLALFAALAVGLPALAGTAPAIAVFDAFFRAGALVFGGGHVVLPLLEAQTVGRGWIDADAFLAGYGAAQAVPGPLFTFGAYLGVAMDFGPGGLTGATLALLGIFLPGMLLLLAILPHWDRLRRQRVMRGAVAGANAAVVGLLAAALYDPVFVSAVHTPADFGLAATGFVALVVWRAPPWVVVIGGALGGLGLSLLGA